MFNDLLRKHPKISYYASDSDIMTSHGVQGMISYFPSEILYSQISHYLLIKSPTHPLSWLRKHHQTHINSRHPSYLQTDSQHGSWVYILGFVVTAFTIVVFISCWKYLEKNFYSEYPIQPAILWSRQVWT